MRDEIIRMAREAGLMGDQLAYAEWYSEALERFYNLAVAEERNKLTAWMMQRGYATGHGDTVEDLLKELEWQVRESEREQCAKVADSWNRNVVWEAKTVSMNIAKEIRARGKKK